MRISQYFIPTLKEFPSDAVQISHILMIRTGMIRQLTTGVYSYLPLGVRVFRKIENIVREEMNRIGGKEFYLPALSPNELWAQTGRLDDYGDDIFRIKNRELVLAPTHEEVFTSLAKANLISYKDFPQIWYQIQTKFRNEPRPRGGVLRSRQFTMKDSYSFDSTPEGLDDSYKKHDEAYRRIFDRAGLKYFVVTAFSGAMGGSESEEFMVEAEAGEDSVVLSEDGSYSSNLEVAESYCEEVGRINSNKPLEEFHTPDIKTIEQLAEFVSAKDKSRLAKSRIFVIPGTEEKENRYILALCCGNDEFNEAKLVNIFGIGIRSGLPDELMRITGADAGSIGPVNVNERIEIIADKKLRDADELISGANRNDYHLRNIDLKRDVKNIRYYDLRIVQENEMTIDRKSKLRIVKAIETGHIFKLGTKYAESLNAKFLDRSGKENVIIMGSYGIGIERIAAAFIEQNHDKDGIIWKGEIAPFSVHLICVNPKNDMVKKSAEDLYVKLNDSGIEVLYDDREDISAGFKFKDADLLGIPLQVIISEKNLKNNNAEIKIRKTGERLLVSPEDLQNRVSSLLTEL